MNQSTITRIKNHRKQIGRKLAQARADLKISKYQMGKDYGLNCQQIDAIERGTTNYTIDSLQRFTEAVGLRLADL